MATLTKETAAPVPSSSAPTPEDEALKRNTDCVYFLASPLTCKKGNECEYRHSEYARVNPRDCWYWMNGNCLNPKCSFRHPPLDTLIGPQAGNFAGPSLPVPPTPPATIVPSTPQGAAKQATPCIFFQKGYCLKGDRCPFLHGPNPLSNKVQQGPAITPVTEPPTFKKTFGGLEKCTQTKANVQANASKVVEAPPQAKSFPKVEAAFSRDGMSARKRGPSPGDLIEKPPKYKVTDTLIDNENSRSRPSRAHHAASLDDQSFQNGKDADDGLRESSPGFDVLVDDKLRGDEYYQHEDQYVRMRGHEGRSLNEFEMGHHDDYNSAADVDPEIYLSRRGYDSYDCLQERYAWDQHRASSERSLGESAHYDRRDPYKSKSPEVQNSDLRYRLSNKHRRVNGLKSVVNPDCNPENHPEDRGHQASRRESRRSPTHEISRSSRLQGRLKLARRDSPPERESERGRNWGRLSPSRPQVSSSQPGRLRDRLSVPIRDEKNEGRNLRGPGMRRDSIKDNGTNFAAPKSLAELKGTKQADTKQQQSKIQQSVSGGKLRDTVLASSVGVEGNLSFEGPKPLSEILKRKRDVGGVTSTSGVSSGNKEENKNNVNTEDLISSNSNSAADAEKHHSSVSKEQAQNGGEPVIAEADEGGGEISNKKMKLIEDESSIPENKDLTDREEGLVAAEGEEQGFDEEYDQGDLEYEYEQDEGEGEGYDLNEGETTGHEEDFMDEDDGDDFAKKLGVSI